MINDEIWHATFFCIFWVQVASFVVLIWTAIRAEGSDVPSYSLMDLAIVTTKFSITSKNCFQDSPHVNIPNNIIKLFASMFPKKYQESLRLPLYNIFPKKYQESLWLPLHKIFPKKYQESLWLPLHNIFPWDKQWNSQICFWRNFPQKTKEQLLLLSPLTNVISKVRSNGVIISCACPL